MKVFVKCSSRNVIRRISLDVEVKNTVSVVKHKIQEQYFNVDNCWIELGKRILHDANTLEDYNIHQFAELEIIKNPNSSESAGGAANMDPEHKVTQIVESIKKDTTRLRSKVLSLRRLLTLK